MPRDANGVTSMPAIYAQAYQGGNGKRHVVLTNKGSNAAPAQITQDGVALTNQLLETFVTGSHPGFINTNPPPGNIVIQAQMATNPVTIPQYSVVRLEWTAFNVPRPALAVTASNGVQELRWIGLTNVIYNVQATANLPGPWTTLGRVTSTGTNFAFTNWSAGLQQFYRLMVP